MDATKISAGAPFSRCDAAEALSSGLKRPALPALRLQELQCTLTSLLSGEERRPRTVARPRNSIAPSQSYTPMRMMYQILRSLLAGQRKTVNRDIAE